MSEHQKYMHRCLQLAAKGLGQVAPNPMVGCVIVCEGQVIGEGYHQRYGEAHAEVNAIASVKDKSLLKKSTLYVNLEPCAHFGKTPPCASLIVEHKIPYVVIGSTDPNPLVAGKGIQQLISGACDVKVGVLEDACKELNRRFFTSFQKKRPYIILKWAQTADGFIDSQRSDESEAKPLQISNASSRKLVHKWRSEEQAIMVGTNTALLDNPRLTVREWAGKNPLRIVIDRSLRIPKHYHLLDHSAPTLVFTQRKKASEENLEYIQLDFNLDILPQIIKELYQRNIQSLIVEGGEQLLKTLIDAGLWDEARVFKTSNKIGKGVAAPDFVFPSFANENVDGDRLFFYRNN